MTLVVEDGTGVADANSYSSVADLRAFALARKIELPIDDTEVESWAILAMDYLEAQAYAGAKVDELQALEWPRINGIVWPDDAIPASLKKAQALIVMELSKGLDLFPVRTDGGIKREKIGPLETEWFEPSADFPDIPLVAKLLAPYLVKQPEFTFQTVRV